MHFAKHILIATLLMAQFFTAQAALTCSDIFTAKAAQAKLYIDGRWFETRYPEVTLKDLGRTTTAGWYFALAKQGKLIDQLDKKLEKRNLIIENGGLCGPTCLVNIVTAAKARSGKDIDKKTPDQMIQELVDYYTANFESDGRQGTYMHSLATAGRRVLGREFFPRYLNTDVKEMDYVLTSGSGLVALTVEFVNGNRHVVTLLKIDQNNQTMIVSDPNEPKIIYRVGYVITGTAAEPKIYFHSLNFAEHVTVQEAYFFQWQ